jgi:hypothetical protein
MRKPEHCPICGSLLSTEEDFVTGDVELVCLAGHSGQRLVDAGLNPYIRRRLAPLPLKAPEQPRTQPTHCTHGHRLTGRNAVRVFNRAGKYLYTTCHTCTSNAGKLRAAQKAAGA